ncbi:NUDIX hydrolase [Paenibacillus paeoniae]|uniref:NUDIX hydrolase n=1 Tax=Paenibacillus paeoniae TaxID=2292705 RepID=UPI0014034008|nr:NUDIX domain-containing protein [Paenibacillus paeoniae]
MNPKIMKVVAYITRTVPGNPESIQLLVNVHTDLPEAGIQVPAGTIEAGETAEVAVIREVYEETGLNEATIIAKITEYDYFYEPRKEIHQRNVFLLSLNEKPKDEWETTEVTPSGHIIKLRHYWIDINSEIELAVGQGDFIHVIESLVNNE